MSEYIIDLNDENANVVFGICDGIHQEIVRCRDCAKWHAFDYKDGKRYGECDEWKRPDSCCTPATAEDGFCAWGERHND